jgi:hypothetical protein
VKNNHSPTVASAIPEPTSRTSLWQTWNGFWFTPTDPIGLHVLRLLAGLLFLAWLISFWGRQDAFFGLNGWIDRQAYREASRIQEELPSPIGWSVIYLAGNDSTLLNVLYFASLGIVSLFTLGVATRVTGILTWVVVVSFQANPAIGFDADALLGILAFYLMIGYVLMGQWDRPQNLLGRLLGDRDTFLFGPLLWRKEERPAVGSVGANLALRLFQVHFAVVLVTSGLHKLQFGEYWGGIALWFPMNPALEVTQDSLRRQAPNFPNRLFFLSLAQYLMLAWQIGFPTFAWRKGWRPVLIGGGIVAWLGSSFVYRLPLFGPMYLIGCLSYLTAAEWRWLGSACAGLLSVVRAPRRAEAEHPSRGRPQRMRTH